MRLLIRGRSVKSIFSAYGTKENSRTRAVGAVLAASPNLCRAFLRRLGITGQDMRSVEVRLQKREKGGVTDLEITDDSTFHVIVEAKRGWKIPNESQLKKYTRRFKRGRENRIVSMSSAWRELAEHHFKSMRLNQCEARHLSWDDVRDLAERTLRRRRPKERERILLRELVLYLLRFASRRDKDDELVYVAFIKENRKTDESGSYTFMDVVKRGNCYFHPVGSEAPANYLAFRWDGWLQSIYKVKGCEVGHEFRRDGKESEDVVWRDEDEFPHFIYTLGKKVRLQHALKDDLGRTRGGVWIDKDILLSGRHETLRGARAEADERRAQEEEEGDIDDQE